MPENEVVTPQVTTTPVEAPAAQVPPTQVTPPATPVLPEAPTVEKPVPTGNAFFDGVQNVLYDKGVDSTKYLDEVAANQKLSPESRAELVGKLGEAQVALIEQGLAKEITTITEAKTAEAQKVFDSIQLPGVADGKEAFAMIAEWSRANIPDADRETYNQMLAAGGVQAQLAMKNLKEMYMADPNFTATANLFNGTAVPPVTGPEPISRATYTAERAKAHNARDAAAIAKLDAQARYTMEHRPELWRPTW